MMRALLIAALVLAPAATVLPIRRGSGPCGRATRSATDTPQKKAKRSMFGGMLGGMPAAFSRSPVGNMAIVALPVGSNLLSDEILKLLDCKEQQQAANATDEAIRGGVGTEVKWKSESRANVSGSPR